MGAGFQRAPAQSTSSVSEGEAEAPSVASDAAAYGNAALQEDLALEGEEEATEEEILAPFSTEPIEVLGPIASDSAGKTGAAAPGPKAPAGGAAEAKGGKPASLALNYTTNMPKGVDGIGSNYGGMQPKWKWSTTVDPSGDTWKIAANLLMECHWDIGAPNKTNIAGTQDPQITSKFLADRAARDLDPGDADAPGPDGKPKREAYWSRFQTAEHEWFHVRDTQGWMAAEGMALVKAKFAAKTFHAKTQEGAEAEVAAFVSVVSDALFAAWEDWFGTGTDETAKPGEQRAYAAGKAGYAAQADGIRKFGDTLG